MELNDYLTDSEKVLASVEAEEDDMSSDEGTLGCTTDRVVYVQDKTVIDIDTDRIDAIEFSVPGYPLANALLAAILIFAYLPLGMALGPTDVPGEIAFVPLILGAIIGIAGFFDNDATLQIYTGSKEFEFISSDKDGLSNFPSAIRRATD